MVGGPRKGAACRPAGPDVGVTTDVLTIPIKRLEAVSMNVLEGNPWPITIRAQGARPFKTKDATVKVLYPVGEESKSLTLSEAGEAAWDHQTKLVPDDQPNYILRARVEYKNKLIPNSTRDIQETCTVWPKTFKLTAVDENEDPVEGFKFRLVQGTHAYVQALTKADTGEALVDLIPIAGAFSLESTGPFDILEQTPVPGKSREVKVKVKRTFLTKFEGITEYKGTFPPTAAPVLDKVNGSRIKVWVNLNKGKADNGAEVWGNKVEFEVAAYDDDGYKGKQNDTVHIRVEFGRESDRNDPEPALLAPPPDSMSGPKNKVHWGTVRLANDAATAKFTVELGQAGGDTCQIKIGASKQAAEGKFAKTLDLINWRRLNYHLLFPSFMKTDLDGPQAKVEQLDLPAAMRTAVNDHLSKAFVEYKHAKSYTFDGTAAGLKGVTTSKFVGMAGRARYVYGRNWETEGGTWAKVAGALDTNCVKVRLWDATLSATASKGDPTHPDTTINYYDITTAKATIDLGTRVYTYDVLSGDKQDMITKMSTDGAESFWVVKIPDNKIPEHYGFTKMKYVSDVPDTTNAVTGKVTVEETVFNPAAVDVVFGAPNTANAQELTLVQKTDLENLLTPLLKNAAALRTNGNQVRIKITGTTDPAGQVRFVKVKGALESAFNAHKQKVATHPGLNDDGTRWQGDLPDISTRETWTTVDVSLPANLNGKNLAAIAGPELTVTQAPVQVKVKYYNSYGILGNALRDNQNLLLDLADLAGRAKTCCHELGHTMGMTVTSSITGAMSVNAPPPGMPAAKHVDNKGDYYCNPDDTNKDNPEVAGRRKIHVGGHCAAGVTKKTQAAANWDNTGTCIMYGAGADTRTGYCPVCLAYIKARNLTDITQGYGTARPAAAR